MNLTIIPTPNFKKSVKKLQKKYRLISKDLREFYKELQAEEVSLIDLGNSCYKARVTNSSIPTGKSGGFRVIYFKKIQEEIYLLEIYSKTEQENISDEKILEIIQNTELN